MSSKIVSKFRQIFCLIIFSQAEFLTAFFDTTIRQNTTQFFDKNFRHDMIIFFDTKFRHKISTRNFDIIFRLVKKIICRKSTAFFDKKLQQTTVFLAKTIQISTNFYRFLQNFTNFFRQKLR